MITREKRRKKGGKMKVEIRKARKEKEGMREGREMLITLNT